MSRTDTFFGKRGTDSSKSPFGSSNIVPPSAAPRSSVPSAIGSDTTTNAAQTGAGEMGSKLIVGPNIKLKGVEINDCDTLVVEGRVEATMDSRVIQIAEKGAFKGSAEIDLAEIRGDFEGDLTVRDKLVIYTTGKVSGKIRYGKLVIEEGGQISGDVQVGGSQKDLLQNKPV